MMNSVPGRPRVLVVDDDSDFQQSLQRVLRFRGFEVLSADNGVDALRLIAQFQFAPDVVLMDIVLPQLNGIVAAQKVLASSPRTVVILMSAYFGSLDETMPGPDGFELTLLAKPLDLPRLCELIDSAPAFERPETHPLHEAEPALCGEGESPDARIDSPKVAPHYVRC